jgi:hypothetical protein
MLESIVDLLGSPVLSALTLLIGSCITGLIAAALRAVGRGAVLHSLPLPSAATQRGNPFRRQPIPSELA